MIDTKHLLDSH